MAGWLLGTSLVRDEDAPSPAHCMSSGCPTLTDTPHSCKVYGRRTKVVPATRQSTAHRFQSPCTTSETGSEYTSWNWLRCAFSIGYGLTWGFSNASVIRSGWSLEKNQTSSCILGLPMVLLQASAVRSWQQKSCRSFYNGGAVNKLHRHRPGG